MRIWVGGAHAPEGCVHVADADDAIDFIIEEERFCEANNQENDIKSISVYSTSDDADLLETWLAVTGRNTKYILTFRNYESEATIVEL